MGKRKAEKISEPTKEELAKKIKELELAIQTKESPVKVNLDDEIGVVYPPVEEEDNDVQVIDTTQTIGDAEAKGTATQEVPTAISDRILKKELIENYLKWWFFTQVSDAAGFGQTDGRPYQIVANHARQRALVAGAQLYKKELDEVEGFINANSNKGS